MLNIIIMIIVICVAFALVEATLFIALWQILLLINLASNPYRKYHIFAFFGLLTMMVIVVVKFFQMFIPYVKLLDI